MEKFSPKKLEKEVISIRVPANTLSKIDKQAKLACISRNEFINQCITFALANIEKHTEG